LNYFSPAPESLLEACIYEDFTIVDGIEYKNDGVHALQRLAAYDAASSDEKNMGYTEVGLA